MRLFRIAAVLLPLFLLCQITFGSGGLSNRRAPGFSITDSTGKQIDPADYRGKVIVIEVMQTHCPACKVMSGTLEQVRAKYGARIQVLSIVTLPDTLAGVQQYIQENKVSSPILLDCGQVIASYLKVTPQNPTVKFPHVFLIDQDGTIRNDFDAADANSNKVTPKTLSTEIDKLLSGAEQKKR